MLAFLMDEDLHGAIVDGLHRHYPELDVVRAIDVGLGGRDDDVLLSWAAANHRVTVSHDKSTMINAAKLRAAAGRPMAGLIIIPQSLGIGKSIADLRFVADVCSPRGNERYDTLVSALEADNCLTASRSSTRRSSPGRDVGP